MQVISIVFAMAIVIQTWLVHSQLKIDRPFYIGVIFFIIALFELVNVIEVYPFVLANTIPTPYLAMWLHLIMRFLLAVGFILMIVKSEKYVQSNSQVLTYGKVSVLAVITLMILNNPPHFLQQFIVEGIQQPLWQYAYK